MKSFIYINMNDFINLRTSNRKVSYFITPSLRLYYARVVIAHFLGLVPNSGSMFWVRKEPRKPHACEMALPPFRGTSAWHPRAC